MLDSQIDRMLPTQLSDPDSFSETPREPLHRGSPRLRSPATAPAFPLAQQPSLKQQLLSKQQPVFRRRQLTARLPEITPSETLVQRPTKRLAVSEPPTPTAIPIEQFVGLEKEASADLSINQPPPYPVDAIRLRLEGVVMLQLRITAEGTVEDVQLIQSSGHRVLDEAAIKAVARWKGEPAKRWGRAVGSVERLPIRFRL